MKKNILGLVLAIMFFVPSGRMLANDTSYMSWLGAVSTMAGGLPAVYALFSKIKNLYFEYVHGELVDIQNMTGGLSLLYAYLKGANRKLPSLAFGKILSFDDQFRIAANQLYERLTDEEAPIDGAVDLLQTLITGQPKEIFDTYKKRLGMFADAEMRAKIEFYIAQILQKMKLIARINPSAGEEIGLKQSILDMIYRELHSRDPKLPILKEIDKMLDELGKEWQKDVLPGSGLAVKKEDKTITFDNYIGVPKEARDFVEQIKDPKINEAFDLPLPSGILLTGDPGTGKTHLARAIAGELDCPFFAYAGTDLAGFSYTAAVIRYVFRVAREEAEKEDKKMAIIFIDELDAIGSRSGENVGKTTAQSVIALLTQLDGFEQKKVKVIVIAATNHPDRIDSALTRPGRIETIIRIEYPNKDARKAFLAEWLEKKPINKNVSRELFIEKLADVTNGLSPVDIRLLIENAARIAIAQKKVTIDYDCVARALWNMKQEKYKKQLPTKSQKEVLISSLIVESRINIEKNDILGYADNMTLLDIMEVFEKANKFVQTQSAKTFKEWLDFAVQAQNKLSKIRQNRELIHLCEKIYDPIKVKEYIYPEGTIAKWTPGQRDALSILQPDDIFKKFDEAYQESAGQVVGEKQEQVQEPEKIEPKKEEKPTKVLTEEKK